MKPDFSDLGYFSGYVLSKTKSVTPPFFYLFGKSRSLPFCVASLKKICAWELSGANILKFIICLALWAGKMNQIPCCDWLPKRARWSYLTHSGLPAVSRKKNFPKSHIINPLLTKLVRSTWLGQHGSTASRSINMQKKNLAKIQSSWLHTWSITHTSCPRTKHNVPGQRLNVNHSIQRLAH